MMGGGPRYKSRLEPDSRWRDHAACRNRGADMWFATPENPPLGPRPKSPAEKAAIRICVTECPAQADCLEYAITNVETIGIWGGLTPAELKTERRRRQREEVREQRRREWRAAQ